jgi:hypothetical protein
MGNLQVGFVDDFVAEQHEVEVECAGRAGVPSFAAELALDRHQFLKQPRAIQRRRADDDGVQKQWLVLETFPFGMGFDNVREGNVREDARQSILSEGDRAVAVTEVAAEGDCGFSRCLSRAFFPCPFSLFPFPFSL